MSNTKVSCEAYIVRDGKLLLGKRGKKAKGPWHGTWALPGGHLEFLERADDCIVREVAEELDIHVTTDDIELVAVTDGLTPERNKHYIHLTYRVEIGMQEPKRNEPDMCEGWQWFPVDNLPENISSPHAQIFDTIHSGRVYKPA